MDTNTITLSANGNPILTWALRYQLTDALTEMASQPQRGYGDPGAYLSVLQHTRPDTEITPDHTLADALVFFGIHEF